MQKKATQKKGVARLSTKNVVFLSLMVALYVIFGAFFTIQLGPEIRISVFAFLPIAVAAMYMGPFYGALTGAVGDIVNFLVITHVYGPYFPGYTLTALLTGLWFGFALYNKKLNVWRAILCIVPVIVVCEMGLNSLWTYLLYYKTFWAKLPMRLLTNVIECPLKICLLMFLAKALVRVPDKLLRL